MNDEYVSLCCLFMALFLFPSTFAVGAHHFQNTKPPEIYKHFPTAAKPPKGRTHTHTHTLTLTHAHSPDSLRATRLTLSRDCEILPSISASPSAAASPSSLCSAWLPADTSGVSVLWAGPKHICPPFLALHRGCRGPAGPQRPPSERGQIGHAITVPETKRRNVKTFSETLEKLRSGSSAHTEDYSSKLLFSSAKHFIMLVLFVLVRQLKTDTNVKHGWINPG